MFGIGGFSAEDYLGFSTDFSTDYLDLSTDYLGFSTDFSTDYLDFSTDYLGFSTDYLCLGFSKDYSTSDSNSASEYDSSFIDSSTFDCLSTLELSWISIYRLLPAPFARGWSMGMSSPETGVMAEGIGDLPGVPARFLNPEAFVCDSLISSSMSSLLTVVSAIGLTGLVAVTDGYEGAIDGFEGAAEPKELLEGFFKPKVGFDPKLGLDPKLGFFAPYGACDPAMLAGRDASIFSSAMIISGLSFSCYLSTIGEVSAITGVSANFYLSASLSAAPESY